MLHVFVSALSGVKCVRNDVSVFKKKKKREVNPKIKKAERVLVRLFRILKISCS